MPIVSTSSVRPSVVSTPAIVNVSKSGTNKTANATKDAKAEVPVPFENDAQQGKKLNAEEKKVSQYLCFSDNRVYC